MSEKTAVILFFEKYFVLLSEILNILKITEPSASKKLCSKTDSKTLLKV